MHLGGGGGESNLLYISIAYYMQRGGGGGEITCKIAYVINEAHVTIGKTCEMESRKN